MKIKKIWLLIIVIGFILVIVLPILVNLLTDWYWFSSLDYPQLFSTVLLTKLIAGLTIGVITFLCIYVNLYLAFHLTKNAPINTRFSQLSTNNLDSNKIIKKIIWPVCLFIGIITGLIGASYWEVILQFFNSVPFNTTDPVFNRDLSFYFFQLPFIKMIIGFSFWLIIFSLVGSAFQYLIRGVIHLKRTSLQIDQRAKKHLSILLAIFFLLVTAQLYFVSFTNLLYSTTGPLTGASYTDIHAQLPILWILVVIALLTAIMLIVNIFIKKKRIVPGLIILYLAVAIIGNLVYPTIIQKLVVLPNELIKETPYIERNIKATKQAFNLDKVVERNLSAEEQLTNEDIENNELTIKNIRLWDRKPLLDTFGQIQEIRTYYDFISIDNDRYQVDGEYRQTMLSPRELNTASLPSATFINERLIFTHGFGLALGPVNEVTKEGLPLLFVKDLPPKSSIDSIKVEQPEIYFGELSSDYVFVNTNAEEFNYPSGDENVFTEYQGQGGVKINSFIKKALFALRFNSLKVLLSNDINTNSSALYYRNISIRVRKILPFLEFDSDPYLIITDEGKLKWIYDAYTTSNAYPYAEAVSTVFSDSSASGTNTEILGLNTINYMRNSVKIVIDAYDGKMQLYLANPDDPIIQTYLKIFPNTFQSLEAMPQDIRTHIRYPEDIFKHQTFLYATYHMGEAQIFYNKEDKWEVPRTSEEKADPMMRHMIMKLPEEEMEEFILMLPFTPRKKDNMAAWMVARSDGENYGELVAYRFPKQKLVFGPKQIVNRINQDADISRQISLWDQRGSEVNWGNLLVIPIEESLLYVRPIYLRASGGKIPELKRVVVAYDNQIAMAETLGQALDVVFKGITSDQTTIDQTTDEAAPELTQSDLINQANEHYQNALNAQRQGDWTRYGQEIEELGKILEKLN